MTAEEFDPSDALSDPALSIDIAPSDDHAKIKRREKMARVYKILNDAGSVDQLILPIRGKGLWSTMYGFIAVKPDLTAIRGLAFYQHGETPGLGGEIDNPKWKAQFEGKRIFGDGGEPIIRVAKGRVQASDPKVDHSVDGLSGATITANGVTNLLRYWLGENGFGPYFEQLRGQS